MCQPYRQNVIICLKQLKIGYYLASGKEWEKLFSENLFYMAFMDILIRVFILKQDKDN